MIETGIRVLHVIGGVSWRYGGTTATVLAMCDALARRPGLSVEIATTDADGPDGRFAPSTEPRCSARIRMFPRMASEQWKFSPSLFDWLWRHAGEYDAIHSHGMWGFCNAAAALAARRHRVPLIVFPQGMLSHYTWSRSGHLKRMYWRLIERQVVTGACRLHLTARGEGREMEGLGLAVPVRYIPLGLESESWTVPPRPDWLRNRLGGRDRGRPLVLFLSRLHPKKGVADVLLPAFAKLATDAFLVVAGGEDSLASGYEKRVRAEIERLGLGDRVELIGPVDPADRWAAFDGANCFVLPSHQENFGLVVTEAMARGCPAVVSDRAYAVEHLSAADAGTVVPLDASAVATAIDALLADPARRAGMGARGREYAARNLGWDRIADGVEALYRECMTGRPR